MNDDAGGWLWLLIDVFFVAVFAAALIYGTMQWRRRRTSPPVERTREDATKSLYKTEARQGH
jgi:hypothetical protein